MIYICLETNIQNESVLGSGRLHWKRALSTPGERTYVTHFMPTTINL